MSCFSSWLNKSRNLKFCLDERPHWLFKCQVYLEISQDCAAKFDRIFIADRPRCVYRNETSFIWKLMRWSNRELWEWDGEKTICTFQLRTWLYKHGARNARGWFEGRKAPVPRFFMVVVTVPLAYLCKVCRSLENEKKERRLRCQLGN